MSILIKGSNGTSGGGSSKGFPPGDVNIIAVEGANRCVSLKWTDPDDTIEGTTTLSTWYSTIIVRKEGSAPTSIKDGDIVITNTTRNKYKSTGYMDANASVGHTYYYRFYTLNTDKVYNDSTSMIRSITLRDYDPILKNNSWSQINAASELGIAQDIWNIGDEIDLTLTGIYNETVTLQIWDFNHFYKSDSTGAAGICFGMKNLMNSEKAMNSDNLNENGWNNTDMKYYVMSDILKSMPSDLQSYIKEVNTFANEGGSYKGTSYGLLSNDKVFLPGLSEVNTTDAEDQNVTEKNQKMFPIFSDNASRIKKLSNGTKAAACWWTRSPSHYSSYSYCLIDAEGKGANNYSSTERGICFCFNI